MRQLLLFILAKLLAVFLFDGGDFINATLVPATFKIGG
jgi:hypothetical protein